MLLANITYFTIIAPLWFGFLILYLQSVVIKSFSDTFFPELASEFVSCMVQAVLQFAYRLLIAIGHTLRRILNQERLPVRRRNVNHGQAWRGRAYEAEEERIMQARAPAMDIELIEEEPKNPVNENQGANVAEAEVEFEVNHQAQNLVRQAQAEIPPPIPTTQPIHSGGHNRLPLPNLPPFSFRPHFFTSHLSQLTAISTAAIASQPRTFLNNRFFLYDPSAGTYIQVHLFAARGPPTSSSSSTRFLPRLNPDPSLGGGRPRILFPSNGHPRA